MYEFSPEEQKLLDMVRAQTSRQNGAMSRGPVTPEGKARSSQNARKYGLTIRNPLAITAEDAAEYSRYRKRMLKDLGPQGPVQSAIAELIVQNTWRLQLLTAIETDFMRSNLEEARSLHMAFTTYSAPTKFDALNRYRSAIERGLHRALKRFDDLKKPASPTPSPA